MQLSPPDQLHKVGLFCGLEKSVLNTKLKYVGAHSDINLQLQHNIKSDIHSRQMQRFSWGGKLNRVKGKVLKLAFASVTVPFPSHQPMLSYVVRTATFHEAINGTGAELDNYWCTLIYILQHVFMLLAESAFHLHCMQHKH